MPNEPRQCPPPPPPHMPDGPRVPSGSRRLLPNPIYSLTLLDHYATTLSNISQCWPENQRLRKSPSVPLDSTSFFGRFHDVTLQSSRLLASGTSTLDGQMTAKLQSCNITENKDSLFQIIALMYATLNGSMVYSK